MDAESAHAGGRQENILAAKMIREFGVACSLGLLTAVGCGDDSTGDDGGDGTTGASTSQGSTSSMGTAGVDSSGTTTGPGSEASTGAPAQCGNGMTETGEVCDDGNLDAGDGCSADCQVADCLVPVSHATVQAGEDDTGCPVVWIMPGTYVENVAIDRDVVFEQVALGDVTLDGNAADSTIIITAGNVALRGLVVTNGMAAQGGGIRAASALTLEGSTVTMNTASGTDAAGGGIYTVADLTLDGSHVVSNTLSGGGATATYRGGGIASVGASVMVTNASTVSLNAISLPAPSDNMGQGGGIYAEASDVMIDGASEIDGNSIAVGGAGGEQPTASGGGLYAIGGDVSLAGASVTNNIAAASAMPMDGRVNAEGGGIALVEGALTLVSGAAVSGNSAEADGDDLVVALGGGIWLGVDAGMTATSSTLAGNTADAHTDATGGSQGAFARGGALYFDNGASVTGIVGFNASTIIGNSASASGDGVAADGEASGGALFVRSGTGEASTLLDLTSCTVAGNTVDADGRAFGAGVLAAAGTGEAHTRVTFDASTVSGNSATSTGSEALGGGVYGRSSTGLSQTTIRAINSTFSGNTADGTTSTGGGLFLGAGTGSAIATLQLASATITLNTAAGGGGGGVTVEEGAVDSAAFVTSANTIIHGNVAATAVDCQTLGGTLLDSWGYNLFGSTAGCVIGGTTVGNLVGMDPSLGALMSNGGPTDTHALPMGSVAVDAGDPLGCTDLGAGFLSVDQRGQDRSSGGRCDIGSYEYQP